MDHLKGAEACLLRLIDSKSEMEGRYVGSDPGLRGYKARANLAVLYMKEQHYKEAEGRIWAAIDEKPDYAVCWLTLSDLYLVQGRGNELAGVADRLTSDPGRMIEASIVRARLHMARREFASARQVLRQTISRAHMRSCRPSCSAMYSCPKTAIQRQRSGPACEISWPWTRTTSRPRIIWRRCWPRSSKLLEGLENDE